MPTSPIQLFPQLAADKCLAWFWGSIYSGLMENPTSKTWYIDDRAHPKEFWILLAIAQPVIWMQRNGKDHIPIGHLTKAVRIMKKDPYGEKTVELMAREEEPMCICCPHKKAIGTYGKNEDPLCKECKEEQEYCSCGIKQVDCEFCGESE